MHLYDSGVPRKLGVAVHVFLEIQVQVLKDEIQALVAVHHVLQPGDTGAGRQRRAQVRHKTGPITGAHTVVLYEWLAGLKALTLLNNAIVGEQRSVSPN